MSKKLALLLAAIAVAMGGAAAPAHADGDLPPCTPTKTTNCHFGDGGGWWPP